MHAVFATLCTNAYVACLDQIDEIHSGLLIGYVGHFYNHHTWEMLVKLCHFCFSLHTDLVYLNGDVIKSLNKASSVLLPFCLKSSVHCVC